MLSQSKASRLKSSGLSLMEMLIVLLIISIFSGMGLFYVNSDGHRLRSEANNLKSTLQKARMEAVKKGESVKITVFVDRYEISSSNTPVYFNEQITVYTGGEKPVKFEEGTDRDVSITSLGTTNGLHVIIGNKNNYYSICVNIAGRIWIMKNDIKNRKPCSN